MVDKGKILAEVSVDNVQLGTILNRAIRRVGEAYQARGSEVEFFLKQNNKSACSLFDFGSPVNLPINYQFIVVILNGKIDRVDVGCRLHCMYKFPLAVIIIRSIIFFTTFNIPLFLTQLPFAPPPILSIPLDYRYRQPDIRL